MSEKNKTAVNAAPAKKVDPKETAKIAAILTAICLVITLALAGTNVLTKDIIAAAAQQAKEDTCREVLPEERLAVDSFTALSEAYGGYEDYDVYLAVADGTVVGAAITTSSKGYGGQVQVMTGIDSTGRVTGVSILQHSETAGLGANAANPKFLNQFITGAEELQQEKYAVTKDDANGTIDAVTAATRSSRAVTNAVNQALEIYAQLEADGVIGNPIGVPALPIGAQALPAAAQPDAVVPSNTDMGGAAVE